MGSSGPMMPLFWGGSYGADGPSDGGGSGLCASGGVDTSAGGVGGVPGGGVGVTGVSGEVAGASQVWGLNFSAVLG